MSEGVAVQSDGSQGGSPRQPFRKACLKHLPALYAMALRLTRNQANAEDLVQETFLKAVRAQASFDEKTNCKAWLFKIMTNTFIDQYRKASRSPKIVELDDEMERSMAAESGSAPDQELSSALMDQDVSQAIESLPEKYRMPILLCDVEEFSYAEIAEVLKIPIGTVMSRLFRGRRLLE